MAVMATEQNRNYRHDPDQTTTECILVCWLSYRSLCKLLSLLLQRSRSGYNWNVSQWLSWQRWLRSMKSWCFPTNQNRNPWIRVISYSARASHSFSALTCEIYHQHKKLKYLLPGCHVMLWMLRDYWWNISIFLCILKTPPKSGKLNKGPSTVVENV